MGLKTRLRQARTLLLVPVDAETDPPTLVEQAIDAGVDIIGVTGSSLDPRRLGIAFGELEATFGQRAIVALVNAPELGERLKPDAVLVDRAVDAKAAKAHRWTLVGRFVDNLDHFAQAQDDPAVDYLILGPVFGNGTDQLELVSAAARRAPIDDRQSKPWFAMGGINVTNLQAVLDAGARRVGIAAAFTRAKRPQQVATAIVDAVNRSWVTDPGSEQATLGSFLTKPIQF